MLCSVSMETNLNIRAERKQKVGGLISPEKEISGWANSAPEVT